MKSHNLDYSQMESGTSADPCPLCGSENHKYFYRDKFREYRTCGNCLLIFVPPEYHLSRADEKARYEQHNNDPDDMGYRQFLERILLPVKQKFQKGARGLDFGCGPAPLLAGLLAQEGYRMEVFDSFYETDRAVLDDDYDFIVSTEVIEHLSRPLDIFEKLLGILKPGGIIAAMTQPYDKTMDFAGWHYKNDPTHICFFSLNSFDWLSERLGLEYDCYGNDIFVFQKRPSDHRIPAV